MYRKLGIGMWALVACLAAALIAGNAAVAGDKPDQGKKIKITKLDDLPQHTYPVSGKVADLVTSRAKIMELAAKVRTSIESDLATYEINDPSTLKDMYTTLLSINLIEERDESALGLIEQIRELESKEAAKLTTGLSTMAMIAAKREAGTDVKTAAYKQAFRRHLAQQVGKLPWKVVEDTIQESKGRWEFLSENLLMGIVQARMEPVVEKTGELSADDAAGAIGMHLTLTQRLALKDDMIAVYQEAIDANRTVKPDIWSARSVALTADQNLTPVLMAAWDSGTDPAVFKDRLFVNAKEKVNGKDDDGNGYIDDVHGIAYDIHARRTTPLLCPLGDAADRIPGAMDHLKGFMDLEAAVDSPEAGTLKQHLSSLDPASVQGFIEDLTLAGSYAHGTHVAGLMVEGNPAATLMIARLSYDHRMIPVARTVEWGYRDGAKCRDTVEYFKQHGVRVVNMSWGEAQEDAEVSLERNGIGKDAAQRREIARQVFGLQKEGLYEAIKNAPDILFVCAAGNADNDVEFDEYIASSFDLPNLLVVGAVDQAGDPTSFTSFGKTVQVYASGFEVDSYVPGGKRMKMSGTSMASPNVANLAGKILAVKPSLSPPEIVALIKRGADRKTAGDVSFLLMNPKKTMALLKG